MTIGAFTDKLPPQNLEAEQSVLGAVLIENNALLKCLELLTEDDFYRTSHRKIYRSMLDLFDKSEAIDLVTITDALKRKNEIEAIGGVTYLSTLVGLVPTAANVRYHAKIVKERALMRSLLESSTDIATKVYEDATEAEELLDYAEKSIFEISDRRIKGSFQAFSQIIPDSFKMIEELYKKRENITGIASGFDKLDELTSGFQRGDLIIIGGRPSMGKTALALNISQHVGVELKENVAVFSLEMSTRQLALRMLCSEAKVNSQNVRKGFLNSREDWVKLTDAAGRLQESPIFIDETSAVGVLEMRAKARRLKKERGGLSMIVVDYLQLMKGRSGVERREQEISEISRGLKALAKELDVPVVALSQLNRAVESRPGKDKKPNLSDLRESGAIEQDADVILFIYRPEVYDKMNPDLKGKAEIIISKQRNGPTGSVHLSYLDFCTTFENAAPSYYSDRDNMDEDAGF